MMSIIFTRACAASEDVLCVIAIQPEQAVNAPYPVGARAFQYRHHADLQAGEYWYHENVRMNVQDLNVFAPPEESVDPYFVLLSSAGQIYHFDDRGRYSEQIGEADWNPYGPLLAIQKIADRLYVCGAGGQVYMREQRSNWQPFATQLLYDPEKRERWEEQNPAPPMSDKRWIGWMEQYRKADARKITFREMAGLSNDQIYICGSFGPGTPVLAYWNGLVAHELPIPMEEAALTGLYIENPESVWICGREGLLLHGSRNRGFAPVDIPARNNLFHQITPYRGKLVMPASVRPGGLYEYDPKTGAFGHFEPRLPRLTPLPAELGPQGGPFFAQAIGDVLWVVAAKDIFRFDGERWERIEHPDLS